MQDIALLCQRLSAAKIDLARRPDSGRFIDLKDISIWALQFVGLDIIGTRCNFVVCIYDSTKHLSQFDRIYANRMKGIVFFASTFDMPYYISCVQLLQILYQDLLIPSALVFFYLPGLVNSLILTLISSPLILAVAAALFNCSTVNAPVNPF